MFWNKKEKLMTWEELQEELNKSGTIFDKITIPFYILEDFIDSLWHKLRLRHIKNLIRLIKIWWQCWNVDYKDMLLYMKYATDNLIETYE